MTHFSSRKIHNACLYVMRRKPLTQSFLFTLNLKPVKELEVEEPSSRLLVLSRLYMCWLGRIWDTSKDENGRGSVLLHLILFGSWAVCLRLPVFHSHRCECDIVSSKPRKLKTAGSYCNSVEKNIICLAEKLCVFLFCRSFRSSYTFPPAASISWHCISLGNNINFIHMIHQNRSWQIAVLVLLISRFTLCTCKERIIISKTQPI